MFIASALILPVGMSYATYAPGFTTSTPTVQPTSNQTNTNQNMTMSSGMNQTNTNQTMTMPPSANQTSTSPAMNKTATMPSSTNQTSTPVVAKPSMLSPLQQVKSGVAPKDVQCKSGLTLIFKAEDGSPACVDPTVAQVLAQRGW